MPRLIVVMPIEAKQTLADRFFRGKRTFFQSIRIWRPGLKEWMLAEKGVKIVAIRMVLPVQIRIVHAARTGKRGLRQDVALQYIEALHRRSRLC